MCGHGDGCVVLAAEPRDERLAGAVRAAPALRRRRGVSVRETLAVRGRAIESRNKRESLDSGNSGPCRRICPACSDSRSTTHSRASARRRARGSSARSARPATSPPLLPPLHRQAGRHPKRWTAAAAAGWRDPTCGGGRRGARRGRRRLPGPAQGRPAVCDGKQSVAFVRI